MEHAGSSPPERLGIDCEQCHPTLAVPDVREAVDFYTKRLGFWWRLPKAIRRRSQV
jgi:hypothetical protein